MERQGGELISLKLSSADFPECDRVEAFREVFGRTILRIEMDPLENGMLSADMHLRALPGLGVASGVLSPQRNRHTSALIDSDDLVLVFMQRGYGVLEQGGRRAEIRQGQVALTDCGTPGMFTGHTETHATNVRLSRARLAPYVANLVDALLTLTMTESPALRLLKSYIGAMSDEASLATPELRQAVVTHMYDLAALALSATGEAAGLAQQRGLRAARLHAIKRSVQENLDRHTLSVEEIAASHRISPSYVRKLFQGENDTFSDYVLTQRLNRAYKLLTDPQYAERKISAIAFDAGFGDLSYFNRTFRRHFGCTPSEAREKARPR